MSDVAAIILAWAILTASAMHNPECNTKLSAERDRCAQIADSVEGYQRCLKTEANDEQ